MWTARSGARSPQEASSVTTASVATRPVTPLPPAGQTEATHQGTAQRPRPPAEAAVAPRVTGMTMWASRLALGVGVRRSTKPHEVLHGAQAVAEHQPGGGGPR